MDKWLNYEIYYWRHFRKNINLTKKTKYPLLTYNSLGSGMGEFKVNSCYLKAFIIALQQMAFKKKHCSIYFNAPIFTTTIITLKHSPQKFLHNIYHQLHRFYQYAEQYCLACSSKGFRVFRHVNSTHHSFNIKRALSVQLWLTCE